MNARTLMCAAFGQGDSRSAGTPADFGPGTISGIPDAMSGSADLRFGAGRLAGEPLESLVARATFSGANVNIENIDARLGAGHVVAKGTYNTATKLFDLQGRAEGVQLSRLGALTNRPGSPNFRHSRLSAHVPGNAQWFFVYDITFDGQRSKGCPLRRPAAPGAIGRTDTSNHVTLLWFSCTPRSLAATKSRRLNLPGATRNHFVN